ncbi:uncharacterized protein K452DRAFT_87032 [Aplosporella prunicola CBS 121167]|uniref:Uncharacterized protein n=1 Tax=Aplosporella prunicola CBS 121167 TaxID=1176127 RepID=A0A6A6B4Y2_9PEZI|nr:uncharacterized protein K452DRAFT_87032 [Aplosporella prunicola CBS 121167]KAF2138463.1 hypothetical protein K452DRAFT_87032 [Aplosporella prunicola CBS 121167]
MHRRMDGRAGRRAVWYGSDGLAYGWLADTAGKTTTTTTERKVQKSKTKQVPTFRQAGESKSRDPRIDTAHKNHGLPATTSRRPLLFLSLIAPSVFLLSSFRSSRPASHTTPRPSFMYDRKPDKTKTYGPASLLLTLHHTALHCTTPHYALFWLHGGWLVGWMGRRTENNIALYFIFIFFSVVVIVVALVACVIKFWFVDFFWLGCVWSGGIGREVGRGV